MKRVSVIIVAAVAMLFSTNAHAQLGIHFGYAPQTQTSVYTIGNRFSTTKLNMNGFFLGVNYSRTLGYSFGLSVGVDARYNTKTETENLLSATTTNTYTQLLIDVPVLLDVVMQLSDNSRLSFFVGPTVSYALSGNTNFLISGLDSSSDVPWYTKDSQRRRLDIIATAGVALTFDKYRVFGGYYTSLLDLDKDEHYKLTYSGIFVGLGYLL